MSLSWKKSLHAKVIWAFTLLGVLIALEAAVVIYFWLRIDQHSLQLEMAQDARLQAQQSAMDLHQFLSGKKDVLAQVGTSSKEASAVLATLHKGGEWKGVTVNAPDRILALSLRKATEAWNEYYQNLAVLTTHEIWRDSTLAVNTVAVTDSLAAEPATLKIMDPKVARARAFIDGQWLRTSALLREFENDTRNALLSQRGNLNLVIAIIVVVDLLLLTIYYLGFRKYFITPLHELRVAVTNRSVSASPGTDEISQLGAAISGLSSQIDQASEFVVRIGEGQLDASLGEQQGGGKLGSALDAMRSKLKAINEEDQKRRWANEGLTQFVDILRSGNDNIHALGDQVISTLVKYTQSNQGGLYLVEEEVGQKYLDLISLFAFNTKKFEKQRLKPGESLVGQCFLEAETIFLTDIPEDYIRITSGLGGANPKSILIVPLKIDKEIYGIVELASFQVYQTHEIAFVEKLGETIASTLSSVKNNQKTRRLLEEFQQQTEQMRAQEEEMRQNMEELTATQEEMTRKEKDYILKIKQLEEQIATGVPGDDWSVATGLERDLRTQLQALEHTQRALSERS